MDFVKDFTEICSQGVNWLYSRIGSDNGLAPNRRQANADPIHWRIYVALGRHDLPTEQESHLKLNYSTSELTKYKPSK